jgi:DNA repair protein SbcC/Rad50
MTGRTDAQAPSTQYVDQIFTMVGAQQTGHGTAHVAAPPPPPDPPATNAVSTDAAPAIPIYQRADLIAELEWLREERRRLEGYTRSQFGQIAQQREEFLGKRAEVEAALALREQELNRQMKILAERGELLQQREKDLARNEAALTLQREELANAETQLTQLQQTHAKLQTEVQQQRYQLEQGRFLAAQMEEGARASQAELAAFEKALAHRKKAWEEEQATFAARREQLEQRCREIERGEASLRRRETELDQMEAELRCEIEQKERQLARERQLVREQQQARERLAARLSTPSEGPRPKHRLLSQAPALNGRRPTPST